MSYIMAYSVCIHLLYLDCATFHVLTMDVRVQSQGGLWDCGALSNIGTDFLLPPIIPPMLHIHLSSGLGTIGPSEAAVPGNSVIPFLLYTYNIGN